MPRSDETLHARQGDGVVIPIDPPRPERSVRPPQPNSVAAPAELPSKDFRNDAQQCRALAVDASMGWIQNEFIRIAAGLDRVADEKEATERMRPRSLEELMPEQLQGLARAYRDLGVSATTDWTRRSFDRIADELARRAGARPEEAAQGTAHVRAPAKPIDEAGYIGGARHCRWGATMTTERPQDEPFGMPSAEALKMATDFIRRRYVLPETMQHPQVRSECMRLAYFIQAYGLAGRGHVTAP